MAYKKFGKRFKKDIADRCRISDIGKKVNYIKARDIAVDMTKKTLDSEIEYGFLFNPNKLNEPHISYIYQGIKNECLVVMPRESEGSFHTHPISHEEEEVCLFSLEDINTDLGKQVVVSCVSKNKVDFINMDLRFNDKKRVLPLQHYINLVQTFEEFGNYTELELNALIELMEEHFIGDII
ncbi:hypothetical protein LCGC14_0797820 [marine sediment metagenome]|uniref:Uncharacterized protein n=1 Tax=marine sediment metagenome TaxID=412755 RepID=A0A0F9SAJ3_9ZZZZ